MSFKDLLSDIVTQIIISIMILVLLFLVVSFVALRDRDHRQDQIIQRLKELSWNKPSF